MFLLVFTSTFIQVTHRLQEILGVDPFKIQQITQVTQVTTICKGILNSFKYSCNLCNLRNLLHFQGLVPYFAL